MERMIIIDGSHRNGNTLLINRLIKEHTTSKLIQLKNYTIDFYCYDSKYSNEDHFFSLVEDIIQNYDHMIWTTPIYWYSMSGRMKVFLDRFTDLIKIHKTLGRKLRGKSMSLIYNSNGDKQKYIEQPFVNTADYLGIFFTGALHINMEEGKITDETKDQILKFVDKIQTS
jgi:multimeric flavodoxin WrbA